MTSLLFILRGLFFFAFGRYFAIKAKKKLVISFVLKQFFGFFKLHFDLTMSHTSFVLLIFLQSQEKIF